MGAVHGDVFDVEVVKNAQGYNDWMSVKKSDGSAASVPTAGTAQGRPASATSFTASPKSTYPTDEERAKTQIYIVRQSNLTAAINLLSVGAKTPPKTADIIETAKIFENHVFGTSNDSVVDAQSAVPMVTDFDDLDDLPV